MGDERGLDYICMYYAYVFYKSIDSFDGKVS